MDLTSRIVLIIQILTVSAIVRDTRIPDQKIATESKMFEIDKTKLQHYWQYATANALIKSHTRYVLQSLPKIERIVFEQCARDAKTVIQMSKCAVRVFDAKQNAELFKTTTTTTTQKPMFNSRFYIRPHIKKIQVAPAKQTHEIGENRGIYYYSSSQNRWVQNPIRRQSRNRIKRNSDDEIMNAYEMFLAEQRKLKKMETRLHSATTLEPMRNSFGILRHMKMNDTIKHRKKRGIDEKVQEDDKIADFKPSIDFKKLAAKYFQHLVSGGGSRNHLDNIRRIRNHYLRVEKCNGYFKLMNDENRKLFDEMNLGINSKTPTVRNDEDGFEQILQIINQFSATELSHEKFSFLSPRILSIMPEGKKRNHLLSPTILSFQKDGFFSLPDLFTIVSSNQRYNQLMLEGIMDLSGAGEAVEQLLTKIEPDMKYMEEVQYPMVQKMSRQDINWLRAKDTFTPEQNFEYQKYGFAHLNEDQIRLIYSENPGLYLGIANLTRDEREARIEKEIRKLAAEGRPQWPFWNSRVKRATEEGGEAGGHGNIINYPEGEEINGVEYMVLKPHAFANLVNFGVSMEAMILSPHAFISEIMRPEALKLDVLSPRAFVATVLSPSALIARILSPTAFRAEVLSPRALTAWVLSPEALVAEVLSPRFLEPRVLSPEALVIDVLSPGILAPHVMSSETIGVMVLSPNILSPRIASDEKFLVEILSPHILGGPHSEEEEEHGVLEVGDGGLGHEGHNHPPGRNSGHINSPASQHSHDHGHGHEAAQGIRMASHDQVARPPNPF
ncbi:unnamed protein product [Caenorhabditis angaria]|uniref:Uncharacterized protein n=1 Tax=Caenorhabditis angaria TaxID=860376 RepID=A0A9P1J0L7_9PELO|nr:unnamed protein product [Caenorhabditis angaria]